MRRVHGSVSVLLGLLTACAAGAGAPGGSGSGEVVVQVYSGFASSAPALTPAPAHFVVDVSSMVTAPNVADDEQRRLAQNLILPYLARHPGVGLEAAAVHVFRRAPAAPGETCSDPGSGASLAAGQALARLDQELSAAGAGRNARVVLFSGFEGECVPRLCEAAARLVERGAWLDVVAVQSDAAVPPCLAPLRPAAQAPIPWLASWSAKPPSFRIETVAPAGAEPQVLAQGDAGTPVRIPAGLRRIRIALDPPEVIGPIQVRADQRLRVRVLDFPLSAPGERSWTVDVDDAGR